MCSEAHTQPHPKEGLHCKYGLTLFFTACITEVVIQEEVWPGLLVIVKK